MNSNFGCTHPPESQVYVPELGRMKCRLCGKKL